MPTIKRKVEMNLPELIEWGFDKWATGTVFASNEDDKHVSFLRGELREVYGIVNKDDLFEVKVEKQIDEDEVFDVLVAGYISPTLKIRGYEQYSNRSINEILHDGFDDKTTHIYFENEDKDLELIWKNGKLVE